MKKITEYCAQTSSIDEYMMNASNVHPIKLDEYLSTKIKDVSKIHGVFPTTFDIDKIMLYLDESGFKSLELHNFDSMDDVVDVFEGYDGKSYLIRYYSEDSFWFRMFNGGKITSSNPLYTLQKHYYNGKYDELYAIETRGDINKFNIYNEFVKSANKFFEFDK